MCEPSICPRNDQPDDEHRIKLRSPRRTLRIPLCPESAKALYRSLVVKEGGYNPRFRTRPHCVYCQSNIDRIEYKVAVHWVGGDAYTPFYWQVCCRECFESIIDRVFG